MLKNMLYYATFVSGTQSIIAEIIRSRLPSAEIQKLLDGAVVFQTDCTYDRLNFFCFQNIFSVLDIAEGAPIEQHIQKILKRKNALDFDRNIKRIATFRVVTSHQNNLIPINEGLKDCLEKFIAQSAGLRVNRSNPDTEYWFLYRSEGFSIFMKRLTRRRSNEKALHKGELPPNLAYTMCWLAKPKPGGVVLDPFCGYGSIPAQLLKHFPAQKCCMFDINKEVLETAKLRLGRNSAPLCRAEPADVYDLPALLPGKSVDAVITDPPWGMYETLPVDVFYKDMMRIFAQLLKPDGSIILLTACEEALLSAAVPEFTVKKKARVLVSGKKAGIFHITFRP